MSFQSHGNTQKQFNHESDYLKCIKQEVENLCQKNILKTQRKRLNCSRLSIIAM